MPHLFLCSGLPLAVGHLLKSRWITVSVDGNLRGRSVDFAEIVRGEFDPNRSPFSSNIFQAPAGMRLLSGPPVAGTKPGSYKYRLWLNDQMVGRGEVILRDK